MRHISTIRGFSLACSAATVLAAAEAAAQGLGDAAKKEKARSVEHLQGLTAEAKSELDEAERALADLLEDARRAGVPPGWLR